MWKIGKSRGARWWVILICAFLSPVTIAANLTVIVLDRDGAPVPNIAVFLEDDGAEPAADKTAVMDQNNTQFVPHLLIVQKGTRVDFPNSDIIAHHVYSFSEPNDFLLPLYKGDVHAPVQLNQSGVVTLGCNIHDQMLGYILIVDSSVFGKTDRDGKVVLAAPPGADRSVGIWSPRIKTRGEELTRATTSDNIVFRLKGRLRPAHATSAGGIEWTDY